jgi:hypothetical protein
MQHLPRQRIGNYQQREQIYKLKEKIESTCYQVTQIVTDKRPRLQKLQNTLKIIVIVQMANKVMEEILDKKIFKYN